MHSVRRFARSLYHHASGVNKKVQTLFPKTLYDVDVRMRDPNTKWAYRLI